MKLYLRQMNMSFYQDFLENERKNLKIFCPNA